MVHTTMGDNSMFFPSPPVASPQTFWVSPLIANLQTIFYIFQFAYRKSVTFTAKEDSIRQHLC